MLTDFIVRFPSGGRDKTTGQAPLIGQGCKKIFDVGAMRSASVARTVFALETATVQLKVPRRVIVEEHQGARVMMQRALSYDPWVDFSGVDGAGEEEQRRPFLESRLMALDGRLERSEDVQHLIVHRMENYGEMLEGLAMGSRDFK